MPLFFDLGLPYSSGAGAGAATSHRDTRLRSTVKLLELGFSGAAYNVSLRSVFSDKDRCSIAPFPLSSLLAAAPSLSATSGFHRKLLGFGGDAGPAFRQFSRVTVPIETVSQAGSIGSTNAILRGYDIVAIRPVSQSAFDHACKCSEVDLISIDFSQKLPFRLRHQSVELAIKRGLYFEITYSQLLSENTNIKRQMISDAKLLVDWTRGKNIIVTSGAFNANEIRGPNDVSNLISFLLGFSKERAKSAISDNCRALLANALRKKHFYKETIRIERISNNKLDLKKPFLIGDWINWDPISSGEGDLFSLEDISRISSSNPNNNAKAIDFDSILQGKPFLLSQQDTNEIDKVKYDLMQLDNDSDDSVLKKCGTKNDQIALELGKDHDTPELKESIEEINNSEWPDFNENGIEKDHNTLESNDEIMEGNILVNDLMDEENMIEKIEEMKSEKEKQKEIESENEIIEFGDKNLEREESKRDNLLNNLMDQGPKLENNEEIKSEKENESVNSENNEGFIGNILLNNLMDEEAKIENNEEMRGEKENENENNNSRNNEVLIGKIEEREDAEVGPTSISSSINISNLGDKNEDIKTPRLKQGKRCKNRVRNPVYALPFKGFLKPMLFKRKKTRGRRLNKLQ